MALTKEQLLGQALETVGAVTSTCDATDWLNNILGEVESAGYWRFLESTVASFPCSTASSSVQFSDDIYAGGDSVGTTTIADFSKGLQIWSGDSDDTGRKLIQVSKAAYDEMNDNADGFPLFFAVWDNTIFFYPHSSDRTTGAVATSHTMTYFREITYPDSAATDIETVTGIKPKYHPMLIHGVIAEGMARVDDTRQELFRAKFEKGLATMLLDNEDYSLVTESVFDHRSKFRMKRST